MILGTDTTITVGLLVVLVGVASTIGVGLFRIARAETALDGLRADLNGATVALREQLHSLDLRVKTGETQIPALSGSLDKLEGSIESLRDEMHAMREDLLTAIRQQR